MRRLLAVAAALALGGCAARDSPIVSPPVAEPAQASCPLCLDPSSPEIAAAFAAAVEDARYPGPEKISRDLTPILPATDGLIWDDRGRILMTTWTRKKYFSDPEQHRRGEPFVLAVDTWLTAAPFVHDFCRELALDGVMLDLRLAQLLGLPPGRNKDAFLEIWVDPADLFRPCPDPEISDHECLVEVPVQGRDDQRPWDCTGRPQVSGRFVTIAPSHLEWMCYNWRLSYGSDDPLQNYPWTALGYTYDWGNPDDPRGPSEYVAPKGSEVGFHSLTPTELFCSSIDGEE